MYASWCIGVLYEDEVPIISGIMGDMESLIICRVMEQERGMVAIIFIKMWGRIHDGSMSLPITVRAQNSNQIEKAP